MNTGAIAELIKRKAGHLPKTHSDDELAILAEFLKHPITAEYLRRCVPAETTIASDVRLLALEQIIAEMGEGAAPGSYIRPFGYLIVATSVGGNAIVVDAENEAVFWADHDSFSSDTVSYNDRTSGQWKYLHEVNAANVRTAMVLLADKFETFLIDLLLDHLTAQLDALD